MSMQRGVPDPYRELGVQRAATAAQIKAAHRKLAKRYHPDAPEANTARFLAIQEAYLLLSDPLRRRDWDGRHAPGPVRAGEGGRRPASRPRAGDGRWTREEGAAGGTPRPRPAGGGGGAKRPAAGRPERPSTPGTAAGAGDEGERRAETDWSASGRDPSARRYRWSAENVPWWEDFTPHSGAKSGPEQRAKTASPGGEPAGAGGGAGKGSGAKGPGSSTGGAASARAQQTAGPGPRSESSAPPTASPESGDATPGLGDIYSRSSGAAWSSAARQYFRKAASDLPNRGSFVYRGTQVVTGAEAREASDDLLRQRPGVGAAPRQAFDPRPADGPPRTSARGTERSARAADGRTAPAEPWPAHDGRPEGMTPREPRARGLSTPLLPPAAAGGIAAIAVTVPLLILGSFVLSPPLQPGYAAILLLVAAITGALAAAVWVRLRDT